MIAALEDKKRLPRQYEEKSEFQSIAIELYKQRRSKATKKEHIGLVIVSTGVYVVSKTDDEMYVLSIIKIYSYYSFVFSIVPLKIELKRIWKATLKVITTTQNRR